MINFSAPEAQYCEIEGKKVLYDKCTLVYENVRGYEYLGSSRIHYVKGEKIQRNQLLHFYKKLQPKYGGAADDYNYTMHNNEYLPPL